MKARNTKKVLGTVLALGAATGAIVFGSFAAWTATTSNTGNSVTTGELTFLNNTPTAKISATDIKPDDAVSSTTFSITNPTGQVDFSGVTLKSTNATFSSNDVRDDLQIRIKQNGTQIYPATAGTWATWAETLGGGAIGTGLSLGAWNDGVTNTFDVEWRLPTTTDNDTQNGSASFDLTWDGVQ